MSGGNEKAVSGSLSVNLQVIVTSIEKGTGTPASYHMSDPSCVRVIKSAPLHMISNS